MPSTNGGDDLIGVGGPNEGLGVMVGLSDEAINGGLEFDDGVKDAALEAAAGEFGEEALDGIEPGAGGRGEVEDEARMARQPGLNLRMLVGGRSCPRSDGCRPPVLPDPLIRRRRAGP